MPQSGFTPLQIYSSSTASNVPSASNLVNSTQGAELAINIADGKLFYKDSGGTVQVLATKGGVGSSTTTQVLYNSSGLLAGSANMVFDGSTLTTLNSSYTGTLTGGTGVVNLGSGQFYKDASGNVGIGTTSPYAKLAVSGTASNQTTFATTAPSSDLFRIQPQASGTGVYLQSTDNGQTAYANMGFYANNFIWSPSGTEAMRIDSSGNVGIGTSSPATYGKLAVNGSIDSFGSSGSFSIFRRDTNAYAVGMYSASGGMIWDLSSFGSAMTLDSSGNLLIGTTTSPSGSSRLAVGAGLWSPHTTYFQLTPKYTSGTGDYYFYDTNDGFFPYPDNYQKLGNPSYRWTTVYATTALINTSDANQKQQIRNLNDAEKAVAQSIKGLIKAFKFNDSVAEKGDGARIHVGVIAQEVQSAFEAQGLDSSKYAMFCSDTWYEVDGKAKPADGDFYTKETPNAVEVTRLGIRYDQLLAFVISTL